MDYEWKEEIPSEQAILEQQSANKIMAAAFLNRDIPIETARDIIASPYNGIDQPLPLINLDKAVDCLYQFLTKEEPRIYIFGDYDTDGITSTTIALQCLNNFRTALIPKDTEWAAFSKIPEREEGYGLSEEWCRKLVEYEKGNEQNVLVITVDNGITKKNAVRLLTEKGITVLVTDHHKADTENDMTPACICVDPQIDYTCRTGILLAGCGVIFNVMRYFETKYLHGNHCITDEYEYLMAIGTIGDMMKMDYYHGCAVVCGLQRINSDRCPEWLKDILAIFKIQHVSSKTIGFTLSAFLNACGQAGNANLAFQMILEPDISKREELIMQAMQIYNQVRDITKKEKSYAEEYLKESDIDKHAVIIYGIETDFPGIVGKIAYHLSELTNKPAIVYNDKGENDIKGSSRNVNETIPFYDLLKKAQHEGYINSANGHMFAQGCDFTKEQIPLLLEFMDKEIGSLIRTGKSTMQFKRTLPIDQYIDPDDITMENVKAIECFPFSSNWKEPSLCIKDAPIVNVHRSKSSDKNVCYTVQNSKGQNVELWAWNIKPYSYDAKKHTKISLIGTLSRDFRKEFLPMFNVTDFKLS